MKTTEMLTKIRELKELETLIAEAQAEADAIKDELKAELTNLGTDELTVDIYKIRYKIVTSNRFDTTSFKATHKELYEQYIKESVSRRFTVTA